MAKDAWKNDLGFSPSPSCSSSTSLAIFHSSPMQPTYFSSSYRGATSGVQCSSPPTAVSENGEQCSATPSWQLLSLIGCCITATSSQSVATATGYEKSAVAGFYRSPRRQPVWRVTKHPWRTRFAC